ncbi:hypothetical protein SAMN06265218_10884 [Fodinibius sediminis]|uniref:Uncharacterized protein n=1 Tax=Fodinibius sediminis TaxID=1214077 RepID=A0A521D0Z9_9BACT|nr:hypothetical protein SAMN06265218_10884 [Fodinibius sediminis]
MLPFFIRSETSGNREDKVQRSENPVTFVLEFIFYSV